MKLYTGRGDSGVTDLLSGVRIAKDALRIEAVGILDELNAHLGLCESGCAARGLATLGEVLRELQSRLFEIGAELATPCDPDGKEPAPLRRTSRVGSPQIEQLERWIDRFTAEVPPMSHFVLPGGAEAAVRLHVARTVCRRAERVCVALGKREPIGEHLIVYLNRLSDLLFAMARAANHRLGVADVPWPATGD